jgi:hypothetical protein
VPTWNNGTINWSLVDGTNPVIQVSNNAKVSSVRVYSWRNMLPSETFAQACTDYAQQFDFAAAGSVVVAAVAQQWSATGTQLIQERGFGFSTSEIDLFVGE